MYKIFTLLLLAFCLQLPLAAQIFTATLDNTWNPFDDGQQALASTTVNSPSPTNFVLPLPNGQLILACGDSYNQTRVFGLARTNANGQLDATFSTPNNLQTRVFNALALQADGKILAGGRVEFSFASGLEANNLHRYNADGSYDASFTQGTHDINGTIKNILVLPNGNILVAGSFTTFNGATVGRLVRLLPNGTVDATFNMGTGANGDIEDMLLLPDGKVIIAGAFTSFSGSTANRLARLNSDGSIDPLFTASANNTVHSIAAMQGNRLLVAGSFTSISTLSRNRIAILNSGGNAESNFAGGGLTLANDIVFSALPLPDGTIALAGQFTTFNNVARRSHVRISEAGVIVPGYSTEPNGTTSGSITGLLLQGNDQLIAFGSFQFLQRVNYGGITRINFQGAIDPTFNPNGGAGSFLNRYVTSMERLTDGRIMIGGFFSKYNGVPCFNIMRLLPDGLPDPSFEPGDEGPVAGIRTLAVQPDHKTIIAGGFSRVDGVTVPGFARLLENGRLDPGFTPLVMNAFASQDVRVIKLLPDGKMYIGGEFQKIGSNTNLKYIARLMPDGMPDASFIPPVFNGFGRVNSIEVMDDGKVLIGGSGLVLPSESITRTLLRLNTDGSYDASFNAGNAGFATDGGAVVFGVRKSANNQLIVWGDFFSYNAQSRRHLVRLNLDGSLVTPNPYASLPANFISPDKVVEQPDGKLLITGSFNYFAGSIGYSGLLRLNANGSVDNNFRVGTGFRALNGAGFDGQFANMVDDALLIDNKLLVCGGFTDFNGTVRNRVARINVGNVVTPVTWQSFTAINHNGHSLLQWITASEQNNKGFEVQRSANGQSFTNIGFIPAAGNGNSNLINRYSFTDRMPLPGNNYYRLKQVDTDGQFDFSSIKLVKHEMMTGFTIQPTVASAFVLLHIPRLAQQEAYTAIVLNGAGKELMRVTVQANATKLNIAHLPAGSYYVTLMGKTTTASARFIKQ
ncbi:T9SS type A sorting domain-containing protein [Phnomibacter sp. MR]|uniref:T9SS type A sorting domain-containing protein n=1 Tax=Phnomibacter sp. MR TaxID=3042318 RepID=UPI003A80FD8E